MIGTNELIIIGAAIVMLFGISRIPDLAKNLGKARIEYVKAQKEAELEIEELDNKLNRERCSK